MFKKGLGVLVSVMTMAFVASTVLAGVGPAVIKLENKKGTITFQHHKHQGRTNCAECHHEKGPDGKQVPYHEGMKIQKCENCHNKSFPNKKLNKPMKAFHKNCKGCHKTHHGPTKCKECHKK